MESLTILGITLLAWQWLAFAVLAGVVALALILGREISQNRAAAWEMRRAFDGLGADEDEIDSAIALILSESLVAKVHAEERMVEDWLEAGCPADRIPEALARL